MRESLTVRFQPCLIPGEPGEKVDEECTHLHRWWQTESTPLGSWTLVVEYRKKKALFWRSGFHKFEHDYLVSHSTCRPRGSWCGIGLNLTKTAYTHNACRCRGCRTFPPHAVAVPVRDAARPPQILCCCWRAIFLHTRLCEWESVRAGRSNDSLLYRLPFSSLGSLAQTPVFFCSMPKIAGVAG